MSDFTEHVGFIAPNPADLSPLFPGYEVQSLIATGGMGAVYYALQISLDRSVAIKILPRELSKDAAFCVGFESEAKAMARLNHPNLIGVYDFGDIEGMLYIVMEFVPGKSLYHSAYGKIIDPKEVIRLVTGICEGLAHAHENGIMHRDIKPSNILLDQNAQPKIGDFGLAGPIGRKLKEGDEIFGTPHYTAPEVVNSPHSVDYRADIFSVGVILHELLTGKLPAQDQRPASVQVRCDPRFDSIIRKATQTLPAARYSSANEMANELRAIVLHTPQVGPTVPRRAGAPARRAPSRGSAKYDAKQNESSNAGWIICVLALVIAAVAAFIYNSKNPPKVPESKVIVLPAKSSDANRIEPMQKPNKEKGIDTSIDDDSTQADDNGRTIFPQ